VRDFVPDSSDLDGMRFDVSLSGLRRITGVRNIRQALASPYPVFHSRSGAAHFTACAPEIAGSIEFQNLRI
jgi:hypothetical protein